MKEQNADLIFEIDLLNCCKFFRTNDFQNIYDAVESGALSLQEALDEAIGVMELEEIHAVFLDVLMPRY